MLPILYGVHVSAAGHASRQFAAPRFASSLCSARDESQLGARGINAAVSIARSVWCTSFAARINYATLHVRRRCGGLLNFSVNYFISHIV